MSIGAGREIRAMAAKVSGLPLMNVWHGDLGAAALASSSLRLPLARAPPPDTTRLRPVLRSQELAN